MKSFLGFMRWLKYLYIAKGEVNIYKWGRTTLGLFEKYLTLWVILSMIVGFLLGNFFPELGLWIESLQVGDISIPMGVCLFLIMYPTMVNIELGEILKAAKSPKPAILTLIGNWVMAPALMAFLARLFLSNYPGYAAGVILLGIAPCTGMVLFWISLAQGDVAKGVVITAMNALSTLILYTPLAALYLGVGGVPVPITPIAESVILFVGMPLIVGQASRKAFITKKGEKWFRDKFRPVMGNIAAIALLATIIMLFLLKGEVIFSQPLIVGLISLPLLIHFFTMATLFYVIPWLLKFSYKDAATIAFISSGTQFEVAIATATVVFGAGSEAALATVVGPLWEVPSMLTFVKIALKTRNNFSRLSG
ncbi:MAG: ACR3 family arsenite efflux transporter [Thermoproteota archaeon]